MKRFFVLAFLAAAAALGLWYGLRNAGKPHTSPTTVSALLPKETLALLYVPDFKRSRAQWHETELYKLWREPAVQDFLQKPLSRSPESERARRKMQEMEKLEMRDAFLAVTAVEEGRPAVVAGFRFQGGRASAEKVIGPWRARLRESLPEAKPETVAYEGHEVELLSKDALTAATVYDRDWFFISNDVPSLKAVLDRVDRRVTETATTLSVDENFVAAGKHMPRSYAAFGYARLDQYMQKLAAKVPADDKQMSALRQIRSIAAATRFDEGKIRDVFFVAMPKLEENGELTRSSLALATKETFLYFSSILNLPSRFDLPNSPTATSGVLAGLQRFLAAGAASGITPENWKSAFGNELGVIGDWPANNRMPALFTTVAVKNAAEARRILETLTTGAAAENWTASERDGVQFFTQAPPNPMVPVAPAIALSPQLLVAGLDVASVESALKRSASPTSELAETDPFKTAQGWVPAAKKTFAYLDTALLYQRLDAALRPMLVMAAAFVPGIADTVDLGKLPAAEVITKHLSPLVMSQSYQDDGYVMETAGPVSLGHGILAGLVVSGTGSKFYKQQMQARPTARSTPEPEMEPEASPTPSPVEASPEPESPTPAATP